MPRASVAVTVSAPRQPHYKRLVIIGIVICVVAGFVFESTRPGYLVLAGKKFNTEVVDTQATRERGLSGRESLAQDSAMLFVFDTQDQECFWMKDMKFAIDMVWLDENKKVTAIEQNVTLESYPRDYCHNSKYVVELQAGTVAKLGLKVGDQAHL